MAISRDRNTKLYFLCENVQSMEHRICDEITKIIGVKPSIHNANKFGYMKRPRIFWGNLPVFGEAETPIGTAKVGHVQEILSYGRKANVSILPKLTTTYHSQVTGKGCSKKLPVIEDGIEKPLLTVEMEKAFQNRLLMGQILEKLLGGNCWEGLGVLTL
ncbi:DNA (cytosine-5)-methyltransferase 3B-like [Frankliniella occidentalis]|uniref:DNA (Cytosine-5)-methyltransferase 3B-like n=1 Tax=Frankliniella occidentalis TaxID=133901 RepID=A0A9C6X5R0_FRAOC|nr:DNA (cytosine-5)-methyltransferase 3B-like [Frankliniella occidentalis]